MNDRHATGPNGRALAELRLNNPIVAAFFTSMEKSGASYQETLETLVLALAAYGEEMRDRAEQAAFSLGDGFAYTARPRQ